MSKTFRAVAMVLVMALATTGAAAALGSEARPSAGLFNRVLDRALSLVSWTDSGLRSFWSTHGGYIDPNGEPRTDGGGSIDPNGGETLDDDGGYIDPNGG